MKRFSTPATLKTYITAVAALAFVAFSANQANAQITWCTWSGQSNAAQNTTPPCGTTADHLVGSGTYTYFTLTQGRTYSFSHCPTGQDRQLSLWYHWPDAGAPSGAPGSCNGGVGGCINANGGWGNIVFNNDNGTQCGGTSPSVTITVPRSSGNYIAVSNVNNCIGHNNAISGGASPYGSAILRVRDEGNPTLTASVGPTACPNNGTVSLSMSGDCNTHSIRTGLYAQWNDYPSTGTAALTYGDYASRWTTNNSAFNIDNAGQGFGRGPNAWTYGLYSNQTVPRVEGQVFQGRFYNSGGGDYMVGWHDGGGGMSYTDLVYAFYTVPSGQLYIYEDGCGGACGVNVTSWANVIPGGFGINRWIQFKIVLHSLGATYYIRDNNDASPWVVVYHSGYSSETNLRAGAAFYTGGGPAFYLDDLFISGASQYPPTSGLASGTYNYAAADQHGNVAKASATVTNFSTVNTPGNISLSSGNQACAGTAITVNNTQSASTGSPASAGPFYNFYWNNQVGSGWVSWQNSSSPTATVPTAVTMNPGNYLIARNSYFNCAGEVSAPFQSLTILPTIPGVPGTPTTSVSTGTGTGCSQFTLNWTAGSGAQGYALDVSTSPTFAFIDIINNLSIGNVLTYNVTGLLPGTTYYARLRSANGCGISGNSTTASATTNPPTPAVPTTAAATGKTCTSFIANWNAAARATSYLIQVANDAGFTSLVNGGTSVAGTSYTQGGLTAGNTYYFRVAGVNNCGTSSYSSGQVVVMNPTTPPAPVATIGTGGCNQFTANWQTAGTPLAQQGSPGVLQNNATEYRLDVTTDNTFAVINVLNNQLVSGFGTTSFTVTGLAANTTYYYRLRAANSCGTSGNSNTVVAVTLPPAPATPTATAGTGIGCTFFTANWNASANASQYCVDVSTSPTFSSFTTNCVTANTYPTGVSGITFTFSPGSSADVIAQKACEAVYGTGNCSIGNCGNFTYYYQTSNTLHCDCGNPVGSAQFVYYNAGYTRVDQDLSNVSGSANITTAIPFSRIRNTPACNTLSTYVLGQANLGSVASTATSVQITGLSAGVTYYYRVNASNNCGTSGYSSPAQSVTLLPATPDIPATAANGAAGCGSITLNWNSAARATAYFVDISTSPSFATLDIQNNLNVGGALTFTQTGLTAGVTYYARVRGNNSCGTSASSGTITAPTLPATPASPAATAATGISCTTYTINWNSSANATTYFVDISTSPTFSTLDVLSNFNAGNVTSLARTGTAGDTYYWRVRASNSCGTSASGTSGSAVMFPATPAPNLANAASNVGCTYFDANWGSSANATGYFLDVATDPGFTSFVPGYNGYNAGNTFTKNVTGLTAGVTYYYRTRAANVCGTSGNSNDRTVATLDPAPDAPAANAATGVGCNLFTAAWSPSTFATAYFLDVSTTATFSSFIPGFNNRPVGNVTSFTVTGLTTGATYHYRLRANNSCGTSANSNTRTVVLNSVPVITFCPGDIVAFNDGGVCEAIVNYSSATATGTPTPVITYTQASGTAFAEGETTVFVTAQNTCGTVQCSFLVTVIDNEPPAITCPGTEFVDLDENCYAELPDYTGYAIVSDNCSAEPEPGLPAEQQPPGTIIVTQDPPAGTPVSVGLVEVTLTATDEALNQHSCTFDVYVQDNIYPEPITQDVSVDLDDFGLGSITPDMLDAGSFDNCGIDYINAYPLDFDCSNVGVVEVTFEVADINGNINYGFAYVYVNDFIPPVTNCQDITVELDENGIYDVDGFTFGSMVDNAADPSNDACGISSLFAFPSSFDCSHTSVAQEVTLEATDVNGNPNYCVSYVTVVDNTPPSIDVEASDLTVECDGAGNGTELADWLASNGGASASDACNVTWSNDFAGLSDDCGETGFATVTFTATDDNGNTSTTTATFTIEDTTPPSMDVESSDLTVECDGGGNATELADWLASNGGTGSASDICSGVTWTHDFTGLSDDCGATGSATVTFTATDDCGNSTSTTATFTIIDVTAPNMDVEASDLTVECDGGGNATELADWLASNGGTGSASDICSGVTWTHDFTGLSDDCGATGSATVTFTATDDCGNSTSTTATFTIEDTTVPTIDATATDLTVECDGAGNVAELNAWLASNGGTGAASDICSGVTWTHDFTGLSDDCGATGSATVTFTATDDCGNSSSTTATFTIVDTTVPTIDAEASDLVVECDGAGNVAELNAWLASNGGTGAASDICSGVTWTHDFTGLSDDCGATGFAQVTFTATDDCGNSSSTIAIFTIVDQIAPSMDVQASDYRAECDGAGNTAELNAWLSSNGGASASDICSGVTWTNDFTGFTDECGGTGIAVVTFEAKDDCGNATTTTATFTIADTTSPTFTAPLDFTVYSDDNCLYDASIAITGDVTNEADNCGTGLEATYTDVITDGPRGSHLITRTWTLLDYCGNTADTAVQFITVQDTTRPHALCQPFESFLDFYGNSSIVPSNVDDYSYDNCEIASLSVFPNTFDCSKVGENPIAVLTVTDVNGNVNSCEAVVTVTDTVKPVCIAHNITIQLDNLGEATITPDTVDNGSNDACGIGSLAVSRDKFGCDDVDQYPVVTLTVTDVNNNVSTCTAVVTVQDKVPAEALCQNVTTFLDDAGPGLGSAMVSASQLDNGSNDACGIADISADITTFYCSDVHEINEVTITVTDVNNNTSECTSIVTVVDLIPPHALCRDKTVTLNSAGFASVSVPDIDNGTWDNCHIASLTLSTAGTYGCANIGANAITLIANDGHGNISTCGATVTVIGVIPSCSIQSIPANNTYTGGVPTNIYLGYGPQTTTLKTTMTGGTPQFYSWSGLSISRLSCTTCANPVFTPLATGNYTFTVTITNNYGCVTTCSITICVLDVRAPGGGNKVYMSHYPSGSQPCPQTNQQGSGGCNNLTIATSAVPAHLAHVCDHLGLCTGSGTQICGGPAAKDDESADEPMIQSGDDESGFIVRVQPNPFSNQFRMTVISDSDNNLEVRIFDVLGQLIQSKNSMPFDNTITLGSNLAKGVYLMEVTQGENTRVLRIIKSE